MNLDRFPLSLRNESFDEAEHERIAIARAEAREDKDRELKDRRNYCEICGERILKKQAYSWAHFENLCGLCLDDQMNKK